MLDSEYSINMKVHFQNLDIAFKDRKLSNDSLMIP